MKAVLFAMGLAVTMWASGYDIEAPMIDAPAYPTWELDTQGNLWLMVWPEPVPPRAGIAVLIIDPRPEPGASRDAE